ncbi:MAG TPA: CRTAC1 family protein [Thermoanaerobaculia bacterium]|nr:CRTAC1 family protein [Thermoanaerobaculia bacterium]
MTARQCLGTLGLAALLSLGCSPRPPAGGMVEVGGGLGLAEPVYSGGPAKAHIRETVGQGACWLDHDRDGDLDLFAPNGAHAWRPRYAPDDPDLVPWRLWVQEGGRFREQAAPLGATAPAWGVGCVAGDVDGDGWEDLYVTAATGGSRLLLNQHGRFVDGTAAAGVGEEGFSAAAVLADLDRDGDLDLFVTRYLDEASPPTGECRWKGRPVTCGPKGFPQLDAVLFWNDGRGSFSRAASGAGISGHLGFGLGALALDADEDGDPDLAVANDSSPNHLFVNTGAGAFAESGLLAGIALSSSGGTQAGMGIEAGDLDGDGHEDLVVTNFSDDVHNFYRRNGPGQFTDWSARSGLAAASFPKLGWAALAEDFDLDGDLDLFLANGHVYPGVEAFDPNTTYLQPLQLLWNDGAGRLLEAPERLGPAFERPIAARGAAPADFDGDGDVDLAVIRDGASPLLLRNDLPAPGSSWVKVRLAARSPGNAQGLGARVEVESRGRRQVREVRRSRGYLSGGVAELVFGLAGEPRVERLTVRWPGSGEAQTCSGLAAGRTWTMLEGEGCR